MTTWPLAGTGTEIAESFEESYKRVEFRPKPRVSIRQEAFVRFLKNSTTAGNFRRNVASLLDRKLYKVFENKFQRYWKNGTKLPSRYIKATESCVSPRLSHKYGAESGFSFPLRRQRRLEKGPFVVKGEVSDENKTRFSD